MDKITDYIFDTDNNSRFITAIKEKTQDWTLFYEELDTNMDMDDVHTWKDFISHLRILYGLAYRFHDIASISNSKYSGPNIILLDCQDIASNPKAVPSDFSSMRTASGKILQFLTFIMLKIYRNEESFEHMNIFPLSHYNYWQLFDISELSPYANEINKILKECNLSDDTIPLQIFNDNMTKIPHNSSVAFLSELNNELDKNPIFSSHDMHNDATTMQEYHLKAMVSLGINNLKDWSIIPEHENEDLSRETRSSLICDGIRDNPIELRHSWCY